MKPNNSRIQQVQGEVKKTNKNPFAIPGKSLQLGKQPSRHKQVLSLLFQSKQFTVIYQTPCGISGSR